MKTTTGHEVTLTAKTASVKQEATISTRGYPKKVTIAGEPQQLRDKGQ